MYKLQRLIALPLFVCIVLACNLPAGTSNQVANSAEVSATPTVTMETPTPTSTPAPAEIACVPTLTTSTDANVRSGPSQAYGVLGILPQASVANIAGKNADGSWWYIEFAAGQNGHAWIAGSITTASCVPQTLAIIIPPPAPVYPTSTFTPVPAGPAPSATSPSGGGGLILIPFPPLILVNSPTPTLVIIIPHIPLIPLIPLNP